MNIPLRLKSLNLLCSKDELSIIPDGKVLINTINAYSYTLTRTDETFAKALLEGDYIIPDGASIVKFCKFIKASRQPRERIAGWDLFVHEMSVHEALSKSSGVNHKVMFMGSSEKVLKLIVEHAAVTYPHLQIITYSPPYKPVFSDTDNKAIVNAINQADPDLLWIGLTAPKQEKWAYQHWDELDINCHCGAIGAVFDFFAGTAKRAPIWWQNNSLEWLYRFLCEPSRMWKRYIIGNIKFIAYMIQEKYTSF